MVEVCEFKYHGSDGLVRSQFVPKFITEGNHTRFIRPVAQTVCKGAGVDIGCNRIEWKLYPDDLNCVGVDNNKIFINDDVEEYPNEYEIPIDAMNIEFITDSFDRHKEHLDYIYSSHCLEHLPNYVNAFEYWSSKLFSGSVLFLYLPHPKCKYWNNHLMPTGRHIHTLQPQYMKELFYKNDFKHVFCSEMDAAYSYCIYGVKK